MHNTDISIDHRQNLTDKIVEVATSEFLSHGVKAVKMDDIAKNLSISKRTLYEIFDNKEQLLLACVKSMSMQTREKIDNFIAQKNPTVIEVIVEFYRSQLQRFNTMSPQFYLELNKYPSVTEWINFYREGNEREGLEFFKKGIEEGYFRKDVNYELINKICDGGLEYVFRNQILKDYSLKEIFQDVTMLYIRGFCTMKGIAALEKLL